MAAIVEGGQWGWGSAQIVGLLVLAVLLLVVVARRIATHPAPIVEPALLAVRAFSLATTLPPERLATGIAVQVTGRQLGSALGAAALVAVVGTAHTAQDFAGAWRFMLAASLLAGLTLALARRAPATAATSNSSEPAPAEALA